MLIKPPGYSMRCKETPVLHLTSRGSIEFSTQDKSGRMVRTKISSFALMQLTALVSEPFTIRFCSYGSTMSIPSRVCSALRLISSHDFHSKAKLHNEHPHVQSYQHKSYSPTHHSEGLRCEVVFPHKTLIRSKYYQRNNGKR